MALVKRSGYMLEVLPGNLDDPFFSRLVQNVKDNTRKEGVRLMVCSGSHQAKLEKIGLNLMISLGCEAIGSQVTRMKEEDILRYATHTLTVVVVNQTCRLERNVLRTTAWPWLAPAPSSPAPGSSVPPLFIRRRTHQGTSIWPIQMQDRFIQDNNIFSISTVKMGGP